MSDNERNDEYQPVGPFEFIFAETWKLLSSNEEQDYREATDGDTNTAIDRGTGVATDGGTVIQQEEKREKEVKNIKQLADRARRYMGDAERSTDNEKVKKIEDEVRQNMRNVVEIITDGEEDFQNVHVDIRKAEKSGEGLAQAEDEAKKMMSETKKEYGEVKTLAEQSLSELREIDEVAADEQVKRDAEESMSRVKEIKELAGKMTNLQQTEVREGERVLEGEDKLKELYEDHKNTIRIITKRLSNGDSPQDVEEDVLGRLSQKQIKNLHEDLESMLKVAKQLRQESEVEPDIVEEIQKEDEETLELLQNYINRHSN